MTIDEAIAQLKELKKCEKYLYPSDIKAIDIALEHMDLYGTYISMNMHNKLYKKQKSINYELVDENEELINENKELKRLLRLAFEELEPAICNYCKYENEEQCEKERRLLGIENDACAFVYWKHAEEAMKILEDNND